MSKSRDELYNTLSDKTYGIDMRPEITERSKNLGLCGSCHNAFIFKYKQENAINIQCQATYSEDNLQVKGEIEVCSKYSNKDAMDLRTMTDIATLIETDKTIVGFKQPNEIIK